jgi:CBS domain-containing protein
MRTQQLPTVGEMMTADLITVGPGERIGRARDLVLGVGIHAIPVVGDGGQVIGIVTSTDLVEEWPAVEVVDTVMSRTIIEIDVAASVAEAAELMRAESIHHLLVVDGGVTVGILSTFDLLKVLIDDEEES